MKLLVQSIPNKESTNKRPVPSSITAKFTESVVS
jgi:hypothetical protein